MNTQVKQRIDQIRRGEVPEGYKKTKAGIVPVEWEEKIGIELFEYIRNGFVGTVSPFYVEKGHKYIQGNNIKGGKIVSDNLMYVNDEFYNSHKNSILKKGDIIIIQSGDVGKCALVTDEYENANCHALIIMKPYPETNTFFISYLLNSSVGFDMIKGFVTGNVLHHILASDYKELKYVIPPLPEQQKIAEILSTQDKLIELQARKIEQLQALKKACLQRMFPKKGCDRPEIRFPEFTDAWEQRKLGECVTITSGEAPSKFKHGSVNYVKVDDLNYAYKTVVDTQNKVSDNPSMSKVKVGSVIFPKRGAAILTNKVRILGVESYMDTNMMALTATSLDSDFLYVLISKEGLYKIADTSTIPQINNKHIEPYEVIVPTLDEQKCIGELFAHLDTLITLHQRKLDEEKQKKKALMQLLLTGIVRVKI